jgi:hypothetical protein
MASRQIAILQSQYDTESVTSASYRNRVEELEAELKTMDIQRAQNKARYVLSPLAFPFNKLFGFGRLDGSVAELQVCSLSGIWFDLLTCV